MPTYLQYLQYIQLCVVYFAMQIMHGEQCQNSRLPMQSLWVRPCRRQGTAGRIVLLQCVGTGEHVKSEQQDCSAGVYEWGDCRYYYSRRNTDRWTDRVDTIGLQ
jgi:hypothetical protein